MSVPSSDTKNRPNSAGNASNSGSGPNRSRTVSGSSSHYHYSTFTNDLEAQDQRRAALQASADQYKEERDKGTFAREIDRDYHINRYCFLGLRAHLDYVTQPCDIGHMTI